MASLIFEIFGWTGVFMVFLAYVLITSEKVTNASGPYQALNIVGALFVGTNAFFNSAYPSLASNIMWMIVSIYGVSRIRFSKRSS